MLLTSLLRYTINKNQIQQIKLFSKINYTNELFIYLDLMTIQFAQYAVDIGKDRI